MKEASEAPGWAQALIGACLGAASLWALRTDVLNNLHYFHSVNAELADILAMSAVIAFLLPAVAAIRGWSKSAIAFTTLCIAIACWSSLNVYLSALGQDILDKKAAASRYEDVRAKVAAARGKLAQIAEQADTMTLDAMARAAQSRADDLEAADTKRMGGKACFAKCQGAGKDHEALLGRFANAKARDLARADLDRAEVDAKAVRPAEASLSREDCHPNRRRRHRHCAVDRHRHGDRRHRSDARSATPCSFRCLPHRRRRLPDAAAAEGANPSKKSRDGAGSRAAAPGPQGQHDAGTSPRNPSQPCQDEWRRALCVQGRHRRRPRRQPHHGVRSSQGVGGALGTHRRDRTHQDPQGHFSERGGHYGSVTNGAAATPRRLSQGGLDMPKKKKPGGRHETPNNDDDRFEMYRWEFPESAEHQAKTNTAMSPFASFVKRIVAKIRRAMEKGPPLSR